MKTIQLLSVLLVLLLTSCSAVRVNADYDKKVDFAPYKTYAFYKPGVDKVEISDLDKRRILRSIDEEMTAKGFTKSETPDLLVNIFTKEREQVNVSQFNNGWGGWGWGWGGWGWGWGGNPWMWGGGMTNVSTSSEGTLTIDLIDAKKKEMIWQGEGTGFLTKNTNKKDENIKTFVNKILSQYPPILKN